MKRQRHTYNTRYLECLSLQSTHASTTQCSPGLLLRAPPEAEPGTRGGQDEAGSELGPRMREALPLWSQGVNRRTSHLLPPLAVT